MARMGGNLFVIDGAVIESLLADANAALLRRRDAILDAADRVPPVLATPQDIDKGQLFLRQIDAVLKEARSARISDGRPFNAALKRVKSFFDQLDTPVKALREKILSQLTAAAVRQQAAIRAGAASTGAPVRAVAASPQGSGDAIPVILGRDPVGNAALAEPVIATRWSVAGVDRAALDLEALRPFFTTHALESAARRHLEQNGPNLVTGVDYALTAKS